MTTDKIREACRREIRELENEGDTRAANALRKFVAQPDDDMMQAFANLIRRHDASALFGMTKVLLEEG